MTNATLSYVKPKKCDIGFGFGGRGRSAENERSAEEEGVDERVQGRRRKKRRNLEKGGAREEKSPPRSRAQCKESESIEDIAPPRGGSQKSAESCD